MPDEPVSQVGDLLAQATGAYTGGDTRQAVGLLDEAIAIARACPTLTLQNGFVEVRLVEEVRRPGAA